MVFTDDYGIAELGTRAGYPLQAPIPTQPRQVYAPGTTIPNAAPTLPTLNQVR